MKERKLKLPKYLIFWSLLTATLVWDTGFFAWGSLAQHINVVAATVAPLVDYEAALAELQQSFTWQRQPINPRAVAALTPWLSDQLPGTIAVDVEGSTADTNQFYAAVVVGQKGEVTATWEQFGDRRFVLYRHLGQLTDGTHVLKTFINTGGSGVFPFVTLVSFALDQELWRDGTLRSPDLV